MRRHQGVPSASISGLACAPKGADVPHVARLSLTPPDGEPLAPTDAARDSVCPSEPSSRPQNAEARTWLPNRRLLLALLDRELAAARREGTRTLLLMLDLDGFKHVNDTHGHHCGDHLLNDAVAQFAERYLSLAP